MQLDIRHYISITDLHYDETECRMVRELQAPGQNKPCGHLFLDVCLIAQGGLDLNP